MTREDRYWAKVDRRGDDECWPWVAFRNPLGYGMFAGGDEQLAHRFGYRLANGAIPAGMSICHHCDNPCCQNPSHLFAGTHLDNMLDRDTKGRQVPGVPAPGEANPMARVTAAQVGEIRRRYTEGERQADLAAAFNLSPTQIGRIVRGQRWGGARIDGSRRRATRSSGHPHAKLTDEQVGDIRSRYAAGGVTQQALADEHGVSQACISSLIRQSDKSPRVS